MIDPRITRLRVELFTAAQTLQGESLAEFTAMIGDVAQALAIARDSGDPTAKAIRTAFASLTRDLVRHEGLTPAAANEVAAEVIQRGEAAARKRQAADDDRPSIAELRKFAVDDVDDGEHVCARCREPMSIPSEFEATSVCNPCAQWIVAEAVPLLLDGAETGIAWAEAEDTLSTAAHRGIAAMRATEAFDKHRAALAKVRP